MDNINLDITTYTIDEIENLLKLKPPYSDEKLFKTKTTLVTNIINSKITEVKKEELLIFLDNIYNKLSNNLVKIDKTNFNDLKQYDGNHFIIKNENTNYSSTLENNKQIDKSIIKRTYTIDSLFRQNYDANNNQSHNYIITLPETINKAITMSVNSIEIPLTYHNISEELNNNVFKVTILDSNNNATNVSSLIKLSNGLYEARYGLTNTLNRAYNIVDEIREKISTTFSSLSTSFIADPSDAELASDLCNNLIFGLEQRSGYGLFRYIPVITDFYENYKIEIDFDVNNNENIKDQKTGKEISTSCYENTIKQKLGWQLGFRGDNAIIDNSGIIVIAATNRPDILDSALLRPGRFDRKIEVMLPDLEGRKKILSVHSLSNPLSKKVDLGYWATRTIGFSGADLANLMNESAIHCARDKSKSINNQHIENALDKVTIGLRTTIITSLNMKKVIAYNEVGRAIVSAVKNGIDSVDKITILPRSGYVGGYTKIKPDEDVISSGLISKKLLLSKIEIALAGRAAETVVYGKSEITQCSSNDLTYATNIVREMVTKYGFSIIGPVSLDNENDILIGDGLIKRKSPIADNTFSLIDSEIINISKISLNNSIMIIQKNRILLEKLVDTLINLETIDNNVFKKITFDLLKV